MTLALRTSTRSRRRGVVGFLYTLPALVLVTVFFLVPLALLIWMSLHRWPLLGKPIWVGLANYLAIGGDGTFGQSLLFTAVYTVIITPILFLLGFGLAMLVKEQRRGAGVFRTVYFMPYVIGFASSAYLWLWLIDPSVGPIDKLLTDLGITGQPFGWTDTPTGALFAVIMSVVWKVVGFTMLLLMSGMQSVPGDVQEAAKVDGAGRFASLWHVMLPLLRRNIALVLVFSVVGSMLAFEQFYILTAGGPGNRTLTIVYWIYNSSFANFQLGYGAAMSVVLLVMLMLISGVQLYLLRDRSE
ncbi:carbohydrate ABC transporter permease [Fodinicola acaciae]|uniref:carbohydrate ABC transporter permease n=1 Tax=Fodinicola acaciae TaxID=2681555 RepID=UPI0013D4DE38|nr:sugar ABC transporter permease [Fodinicola acaciae]